MRTTLSALSELPFDAVVVVGVSVLLVVVVIGVSVVLVVIVVEGVVDSVDEVISFKIIKNNIQNMI